MGLYNPQGAKPSHKRSGIGKRVPSSSARPPPHALGSGSAQRQALIRTGKSLWLYTPRRGNREKNGSSRSSDAHARPPRLPSRQTRTFKGRSVNLSGQAEGPDTRVTAMSKSDKMPLFRRRIVITRPSHPHHERELLRNIPSSIFTRPGRMVTARFDARLPLQGTKAKNLEAARVMAD